LKTLNKFERARQKYKPKEIKFLLIAETPPKLDSNRFFYFENVDKQDSLFIEMMKLLYPEDTDQIDTKSVRSRKREFLEKFQSDGFYLIDSLDTPFERKYSSLQKKNLIANGQKELLCKIYELLNNETKVILIAAPVFNANFNFLKGNGIPVVNRELIDFPGSGGQKKFREKMKKIIA
jgi:hypothetical protein